MKRDLLDLLLGLGVLALGIGLLIFTFVQALAIVTNPGPWFENQLPASIRETPPTSSFLFSRTGLDLDVTDLSMAGSSAITSWAWYWGDGATSSEPNPTTHQYASEGERTVLLIVRDANGLESRSGTTFYVSASSSGNGISQAAPSDFGESFNIPRAILPIALAILIFGLYVVLAIAGGMITKAGWNIMKPRPETVHVRLKPKHLTQAFEEDSAQAAAQSQAVSAPPVPPPPPPS